MALLLSDLGVTKTHSRPHVSNDNPYSEAQFKTLKYRPDYPGRFGCIVDARSWGRAFFDWYNNRHTCACTQCRCHHTGLALLTPADVHGGRADEKLQQRQAILQQAYAAHPERFVRGAPSVPTLPAAVWINPPKGDTEQATHVIQTSDLQPACRKTAPAPSNGSDAFGRRANLNYTPTAGAEDRACPECSEGATLRSDPSADAGDGVAGQGPKGPAHNGQTDQLHCQKSDKPKKLTAAGFALVAASPHHRRAGPASTQPSCTKSSRALSHNS